jgi:hypothetical protein
MYMPFNATAMPLLPSESERLTAHRPATRAEIIERHHRDTRHEMVTLPGLGDHTTVRHYGPLAGIRHNISRALVHAAARIEPQAA